ncbi:MAG: heavy-metal-associated domain-containing protein [Lachnospiraceae bacterium]
MKKIIGIDGMSCAHCQAKAKEALESLPGVKAKVNLKAKNAVVSTKDAVADADFEKVITEAGYTVVSIEEKKGLF